MNLNTHALQSEFSLPARVWNKWQGDNTDYRLQVCNGTFLTSNYSVVCVLLYHDMICAAVYVNCSGFLQKRRPVFDANEHAQGVGVEPYLLYSTPMVGMIPMLVGAAAPVGDHIFVCSDKFMLASTFCISCIQSINI